MGEDGCGMIGNSADDKQKAAEIGRACVCFNIRKSTRLLTAHYDRVMNPTGLKVTQFSLLMTVMHQDAASVSQLSNILGMDRTTLSRNVRLLEQKGLITVSTGEDRREQRISLTDRGREAIDQAIPFWEEAQAEVVARFGEEWVQGFLSNLKQLNRLKS
jgi:DNA-binding MarR family transcriptional regulator